jgi:hypothetical protein
MALSAARPMAILAPMADALPVLWICGPGGVGKTTAGWAYYARLAAAGVRAGFVDIDHLGMCYGPPTARQWAPEPASDPARHRLKTLNLNAVAAHHRALGSRCLVVGGIADLEHGVDEVLARITSATGGWPGLAPEEPSADALDPAGVGGVRADTDGRTPGDIAGEILRRAAWS